jgi:predicted nucleotidyltransferase
MSALPPELASTLAQLERGLRDLYGERLRGLLLYGSYARGEADEGSDVDLLILLDGPVQPVRELLRMEPVTWPLSLVSGF